MSPPRSFGWQWYLCLAGIVLTIAILTITAIDVRTFYEAACIPPGKLGYNLAVSIVSFFALTYHIFATVTTLKFRLGPWLLWINPALDALMFALWLATAMTSNQTCNDICNACSGKTKFHYGNSNCTCFGPTGEPDHSPAPRSILQVRDSKPSQGFSGNKWMSVLKQDLDIILTILFFICLIADLLCAVRALRNNHSTTTTSPSNSTRTIKHQIPGKVTPAAREIVQYLFQNTNVKSDSGQVPQPLAPPRYPQSAHHQQYCHSSATSQRSGTPRPEEHVEPKEGVVETQALPQPVEV